ncbi:uncharacterized protein DS421_14g468000 [Arachis hypogaea]|nr:uncharacterized protein DS421_14g468000 [Arachis hypogaea]
MQFQQLSLQLPDCIEFIFFYGLQNEVLRASQSPQLSTDPELIGLYELRRKPKQQKIKDSRSSRKAQQTHYWLSPHQSGGHHL